YEVMDAMDRLQWRLENTPGVQSTASLVTVSKLATRARSEEHTSELQSRENLVCRLLLEKKNWEAVCRTTIRVSLRSCTLRSKRTTCCFISLDSWTFWWSTLSYTTLFRSPMR